MPGSGYTLPIGELCGDVYSSFFSRHPTGNVRLGVDFDCSISYLGRTEMPPDGKV